MKSLPLGKLEHERLARFRAEWERDQLRADLAKERFEREASGVARALGVRGSFRMDLAAGAVLTEANDAKGGPRG